MLSFLSFLIASRARITLASAGRELVPYIVEGFGIEGGGYAELKSAPLAYMRHSLIRYVILSIRMSFSSLSRLSEIDIPDKPETMKEDAN